MPGDLVEPDVLSFQALGRWMEYEALWSLAVRVGYRSKLRLVEDMRQFGCGAVVGSIATRLKRKGENPRE